MHSFHSSLISLYGCVLCMRRWPVDQDMSQGVVKAIKSESVQTGRAALQFAMQRIQTCSIKSVWRERERERERGKGTCFVCGIYQQFRAPFSAGSAWLAVCVCVCVGGCARLAAVSLTLSLSHSLTLSLRHAISLLTTYRDSCCDHQDLFQRIHSIPSKSHRTNQAL